jgi:hypothetical protein
MKLSRFNIWHLCLAVAASALVIKFAMMAGPFLTFTTTLIFLGPMSGIALERHRGGRGVVGGVIAGILSGLALSTFMNIYAVHLGSPFSWLQWTFSTIVFVMFEAFCGWLWGHSSRSRYLPVANRPATDPEGDMI